MIQQKFIKSLLSVQNHIYLYHSEISLCRYCWIAYSLINGSRCLINICFNNVDNWWFSSNISNQIRMKRSNSFPYWKADIFCSNYILLLYNFSRETFIIRNRINCAKCQLQNLVINLYILSLYQMAVSIQLTQYIENWSNKDN